MRDGLTDNKFTAFTVLESRSNSETKITVLWLAEWFRKKSVISWFLFNAIEYLFHVVTPGAVLMKNIPFKEFFQLPECVSRVW